MYNAWAESWVEGLGWVTVDATPPAGLPLALPQISLFDRLCEWLEETWTSFLAWLNSLSWPATLGWGLGVAVVCVLVAGLWRKLRAWRRKRPAGLAASYSMPDEALRTLAARFDAVLRRRGVPCPAQRTWPEHVAALAGSTLAAKGKRALDFERATTFVSQYTATRFRTPHDKNAIAALAGMLDALEQARKG